MALTFEQEVTLMQVRITVAATGFGRGPLTWAALSIMRDDRTADIGVVACALEECLDEMREEHEADRRAAIEVEPHPYRDFVNCRGE